MSLKSLKHVTQRLKAHMLEATAFAMRPATQAFSNAQLQAIYALNTGARMKVEAAADKATLDAMWRHVLDTWEDLGRRNAMWSVLTNEDYVSTSPSAEAIARFEDSGRVDRDYIQSYLRRAGLSAAHFPVVAEYGCGVGRQTRWLAETFGMVRAFDISEPHIAQARERLEKGGVGNVSFVHVQKREDLLHLNGIDLFLSFITLQHNPPPVILDILSRAFAGLNEGGVALFQVPTYSLTYGFEIDSYLRKIARKKKKSMEMHFIPQADIASLAERHGLSLLELRQDSCVGSPEQRISNTFMFRKGQRQVEGMS